MKVLHAVAISHTRVGTSFDMVNRVWRFTPHFSHGLERWKSVLYDGNRINHSLLSPYKSIGEYAFTIYGRPAGFGELTWPTTHDIRFFLLLGEQED